MIIIEFVALYILMIVLTGLGIFIGIFRLEFDLAILSAITSIALCMNLYVMVKGIIKILKREKFNVSQLILFILSFVIFAIGEYAFLIKVQFAH